MNRRSFLTGSLSLAALPLARPAAAAESIRVGYLGPQTGIFAQAGKDMLDGLKLAFEQVNYQAGGRKVELIEEDTEGNPATAQAKRSEEHTSELQSHSDLVCRLLLEKKK